MVAICYFEFAKFASFVNYYAHIAH